MTSGAAARVPMQVAFAVPGELATPTGGYAYARRLIAEMPSHGIDLRPLPLPAGFPLPGADALAEAGAALAALPADAPVLVDGLALGALPEALLAGVRAPVVALCHHPLALESGLDRATAARLAASERAALAHAARVITASRATAAILARDYDVAPDRLAVAPPGTDEAAPARGSGGPGCRILAVGSLTARKGHDLLVGALARHRDLDWHLRIVGGAHDAAVAAALRRQIARRGLADRVELCGALPPEAVATAYAGADLFALASRFEGFGMAFAEAVAHGLPVVGLRSPAVEEATLGAARLVVEDGLADALAMLVADADERRALAARSRAALRRLPRWPATAAIVADALRGAARTPLASPTLPDPEE